MAELGIHSFYRFKELVLSDEDIFEFLFLEFSINVTELFRDPDMYLALREEIIPYLASFPHVKIWSAGCSTGHEPYSLAILMDECGLFARTQIYASDINPYVVEEAKIGLVANAQFQKGLVNYKKCKGTKDLQKHFNQHEEIYQLSDHLLSRILFFQHSLLNKGSFHEFQLILCRNVLIYFNKELQQQVLSLFVQSLDLNGFLVLGKNETITSSITGLKLVDKANNIYKKIQ
jgi:chemotaxis protein methyltransferase CheR